MNWLSDWVRDVVILVFFVTVAHMLLPDTGLRRYAQLVMGLVIIVALMTPVMAVLRLDGIGTNFSPAGVPDVEADVYIERGQVIVHEAAERVANHQREAVVEQVTAVASLAAGYDVGDVTVRWTADGRLDTITIDAGGTAGTPPTEAVDTGRLARLVGAFFGLDAARIRVTGGASTTPGAEHGGGDVW